MIAILKAVHIASLVIWCAGLILLPILLHLHGRHDRFQTQAGFTEFRWLTHFSYTRLVSPAAVIAVAAGTMLIFWLEVLDAWMVSKLLAVTGMVVLHSWFGYMIEQSGERRGAYATPPVALSLIALLPLIGLVLWLVLAKPELARLLSLLPEIIQEPRSITIPAWIDPL
ncbi:CopD family protein [Natronohydrobacter thiooxidans]|jgi:putative membrane protein|uniref:CopD family protein n=1 Tax=Natronohydrobacter thiooxidans TaxID=87172 RepID=UPI0008FF6F57|nr:CopD family protein [Natronohydrobacter thiooxidans]